MRKGKPWRSNRTFVKFAFPNILRSNLHDFTFPTGFWSSRYYRYNKWHDPPRFFLSFKSQSMTVTGCGKDNIGIFGIEGFYSYRTRRIGLRKIYRSIKFKRLTKSRHEILIQLIWNAKEKTFQGKWYDDTELNKGNGVFELAYDDRLNPFVFEKV
ncbi:unnamed protein product [Rotaria sordida]|uniref:Uncharacterized protein n=1 Tax=Rotaria sordida TaxID=392033 RepID=A0A813W9P2_9BILA|nr:unnamed protein product [Rotaria sordida]CAF0850249.1 unnamed protein product [Rotaria sordida]